MRVGEVRAAGCVDHEVVRRVEAISFILAGHGSYDLARGVHGRELSLHFAPDELAGRVEHRAVGVVRLLAKHAQLAGRVDFQNLFRGNVGEVDVPFAVGRGTFGELKAAVQFHDRAGRAEAGDRLLRFVGGLRDEAAREANGEGAKERSRRRCGKHETFSRRDRFAKCRRPTAARLRIESAARAIARVAALGENAAYSTCSLRIDVSAVNTGFGSPRSSMRPACGSS